MINLSAQFEFGDTNRSNGKGFMQCKVINEVSKKYYVQHIQIFLPPYKLPTPPPTLRNT